MGRHKEPFTLFRRSNGYFYYQTYDQYGQRTTAKSTGTKDEIEARARVDLMAREGRLIPSKSMTFAVYAENWWIWDVCPYVISKVKRDEHGDGLSRDYVAGNKRIKDQWIEPHFGRYPLEQINREMIDEWLLSLVPGISYKYANNIFGVLSVMLNEAVARRLIPYNPCSGVSKLKAKRKNRDLYTAGELAELTNPKNWGGVTVGFVANMLAAATGMRHGEIRALLSEDWHGDYVHVRWSYTTNGRRVRVKNKEERYAPVPKRIQGWVEQVGTEGFLLSKTGGKKPIPIYEARNTLYAVLDGMKIGEKAREARGIDFHFWRHFYNTAMRSQGVPDAKVKAVTGHKSSKMMDHYTTFRLEDFAEVITAQSSLWK